MSQQFVTNALKKVRLDSSVQICSYLFLKILFFRVVLGSRQKREREVPKHPSPYTRTASPPTRSHGFAVTDKAALHAMIAQSQRSPQGPLCVALPVGWGRHITMRLHHHGLTEESRCRGILCAPSVHPASPRPGPWRPPWLCLFQKVLWLGSESSRALQVGFFHRVTCVEDSSTCSHSLTVRPSAGRSASRLPLWAGSAQT